MDFKLVIKLGDLLARDIAGDQTVTRQCVRHRRRADDEALAAAFGEDFNQQIADAAYPVVAAMGVGPGGGDRDNGAGLRGAIWIESGGAQLNAGSTGGSCLGRPSPKRKTSSAPRSPNFLLPADFLPLEGRRREVRRRGFDGSPPLHTLKCNGEFRKSNG